MRSPAGLPMLPSARQPITSWTRLMWMVWVVVVWGVARSAHGQFGPQCEEIKIPMCRRMPYNLTRLPNLLHHSTQENAQLAIEQFELLRWTKCSDQLEFFLCAMYAPICTVGFLSEAIPPCRSVCQAARQGCQPLLAKFHIPWPASLECEVLPVYDRGVCITPQAIISPDTSTEPVPEQVIRCQCREPRLLRRRIYNTAGFHYGLRGRVISVESFGELTLTTVCVQKVAVVGGVLLVPGREAYLWTNRSCACPPLTPSQDYLILGWEDRANSRLLYLDGSIALPFRKKYLRKIKAWEGLKGGPHNVTYPHSSARTPDARGHHNTPSRKTRRRSRRRRRKRRRKNKNGQMRRKVTAEREWRTKTCRLRNGGA